MVLCGGLDMSIPQYFTIVVISSQWATASAVTAILGGPGHGYDAGYSPYLVPCTVPPTRKDNTLIEVGCKLGLMISESLWCWLINPRRIDLWLALDARAAREARWRIERDGPAPSSFYRGWFPDPVTDCGFDVPAPPTPFGSIDPFEAYSEWLEQLAELFAPWKERIWDAFVDSS